jgi:hypothetical protein
LVVMAGGLLDLAATYSPTSWDAVPWAQPGFTAEFGMGSGGAPALWPPGRASLPRAGAGIGAGGRGWQARSMGGSAPLRARLSLERVEVDRAIRTGKLARVAALPHPAYRRGGLPRL